MKLLGIIGGIAPESTIDYYRRIVALCRERTPAIAYPPLLITSIDLSRMLDLIQTERPEELVEYLVAEVERLARAGAELALFASNTPHLVFDEIRARSPITLLSIVAATCNTAKTLGLKRVLLLGTRFTMQARFYPAEFAADGIEVTVPSRDDQHYIHDRYMTELVRGVLGDDTRARLISIVRATIEREEIDGVILGGTELPLLLRGALERDLTVLDTTQIHVESAVQHMFA